LNGNKPTHKGKGLEKTAFYHFTGFYLCRIDGTRSGQHESLPTTGEGNGSICPAASKQDDESAFKVELIVGKTVLLDAQNRYFFSGKIQQETIKGWGFTRYNVSQLGPMAGTQIAVDPNAPK